MKQIACTIGSCGLMYGSIKFLTLTHTLLADGQFFTPILAGMVAGVCAVFCIVLIMVAVE